MDVEKTIQFILETQAKHEAAVQKHDEAIRQADERFAGFREQTEERFRSVVDVSRSLANSQRTLGEETDRRINETGRLIRELRESQAHSDRHLDAVISVARGRCSPAPTRSVLTSCATLAGTNIG